MTEDFGLPNAWRISLVGPDRFVAHSRSISKSESESFADSA